MNQSPQVVLVNGNDEEIGVMEKMEAHRRGVLHRAFSVFIYDGQGRMLLQKRASEKYHSPGLWTNACCSHPAPGETVKAAASRRLKEELGIETELSKAFDFIYEARFSNGLIEHEFDHVFTGRYEGPLHPDPAEVSETAWHDIDWIKADIKEHPEKYTEWFKIALGEFEDLKI